ncbi:two-component sensor histidine kinase [Paenibacillus sp. FSL H8-0548]|uniref:sensor histidine kinase n=1 Tax=Paenibacillus sp. FSL H8-0548 TaxID=1920422 RepID=UPI00096C781B|nr:histidine kinase [Paenibacillus sp. FSL H8-0548]OMF38893.1 two-component sensor histidine kinase [Paenibacillus sp. FSL H8-0548]
MRFSKSIRARLVIGFMAVMLPVVIYMLINNSYSRDIVREKVSETYRNTLDIYVGQTDNNLSQINDYLYKMSVLDSDVGLLMSYPMENDGYTLTKIRIDSKLNRDVGVYNIIDAVFLYHKDDIIFGTNSIYNDTKKIIKTHMDNMTTEENLMMNDQHSWEVRADNRMPGTYFLINFIKVADGLFVGAMIKVQDINKMLSIQWSDGDIGHNGIYLRDGDRLTQSLTENLAPLNLSYQISDMPYESLTDRKTGKSYLVMNRMSDMVNIAYRVVIPEETLLRNLLFFRNATLIAPIGFLAILLIYLFFMRNMLFKPLTELILGMKKISLGMLDVRLKKNKTLEFEFLGNTFNIMAEQIKTLKIDVYEEQLRVKQGELKQLQAQINPHFYMNSLNIIYNLAALGDTESVKKMSLHLADYFRFIMKANRDTIMLKEELLHIENYMTIQKIRFPGKLECIFNGMDDVLDYPIAALTVQPFVENSIIHGFKNRRQLFQINITAEMSDENEFSLTISDNGVGFSAEVLSKLQRMEPLQEGETSRLGIMNVIHRLQLLYGEKTSITFRNQTEGSGAIIVIVFPKLMEGGKAIV